MTTVKLRTLTLADVGTLYDLAGACPPLEQHTYYTYWMLAAASHQISFIAEVDGKPVGFMTSMMSPESAVLWQLGVVPAYRKQGIGKKLLEATVDALLDRGARDFLVTATLGNDASLSTMKSLARQRGWGFELEGSLTMPPRAGETELQRENIFRMTPRQEV